MSPRRLPTGEHVHLRRPTASDRDTFTQAVRASRQLHASWVHAPGDARSFAAYVRRAHTPTDERLLVCRNDDEALVGAYNLSQIFRGQFRNAYLGFYGFEPHTRQGLMREGLDLVVGHAFGALGLHRVEANVQPDNVASLALIRSAGFRREGYSERYLKLAGEWRDHERWAITVEDLARGPQET